MKNIDLIIIGLGNPGEKYQNTLHNIGFLILDDFIEDKLSQTFQNNKKFNLALLETNFKKKNLLLLKPLGFMNKSGEVIKKYLQYKNLLDQKTIEKLIIIHDDSDQAQGNLKIIKNQGSGGHNGVRNIQQNLASKNFTRMKIGIRPKNNQSKSETFVLNKIKKSNFYQTFKKAERALECLIEKKLEICQTLYNKKAD
ncbi:MAG: aminoacyl-tRNA hydrolase [Candidatus Moranbacteria bacterium]|nr:aminoacyl-tRNA hydrolase [Candidatus Moranbacteria bacterium]